MNFYYIHDIFFPHHFGGKLLMYVFFSRYLHYYFSRVCGHCLHYLYYYYFNYIGPSYWKNQKIDALRETPVRRALDRRPSVSQHFCYDDHYKIAHCWLGNLIGKI